MYSHIDRRRAGAIRFRVSRWLARIFFMATLAMIGVLAYQAGTFESLVPEMPSLAERQAVPEVDTGKAQKEEVMVSGSRFTGFDKEQRPFSVTARNAIQDETDSGKVRLQDVAAEIERKSGKEISISSQRALYDANAKTIDLEGGVTISSTEGITAKMEKAQVKIDEHRLVSEVPVVVAHPRGTIRSNGLEIIDDGARILFFNGVKASFGEDGS
jgi:lipopolysaccharide export system protein LptC